MPHQCTNCTRTFADGSKEMLSGCPDCGGNKFQFKPDDDPEPSTETADPPEPPEPPGGEGTVAQTVGNAAATVRELMNGSDSRAIKAPTPTDGGAGTVPPDTPGGSGETIQNETAPAEDTAQATARTEVVSPDEIPESSWGPTTEPTETTATPDPEPSESSGESEATADPTAPEQEPAEDRPDLARLRQELNEQFESIKVLSPGQYELNLMELYDREEYIIALQEDGRYTIQVPETWHQ